jgi:hypothetical protein
MNLKNNSFFQIKINYYIYIKEIVLKLSKFKKKKRIGGTGRCSPKNGIIGI